MIKQLMWMVVMAAALGIAHADPEFQFSGFGTLGIVHSNNDKEDYASTNKPYGAGFTNQTDFTADNIAAVQLDAKLNDTVSSTLQVVSELNQEGNFRPRIEWANIKLNINKNTFLRLGRLGSPVYMVSDYRLVGYASTWVRNPVEVYNLIAFSHGEGGDINYRQSLGQGFLALQGGLYNAKFQVADGRFPVPNEGNLNKVKLLNMSYEQGAFTGRIMYAEGSLDFIPSRLLPLAGVLEQVGGITEVSPASFFALGATYDPGPWLVQSEYTVRRSSHGIVTPKQSAWYVMGGLRFGDLTPYAMFARCISAGSFTNDTATAMENGVLGAAYVGVGQVINQVYGAFNQSEETLSLGLRFDVMKNVALKFQFDHVMPETYGIAFQTRNGPVNSNVNLFTAHLDFVF